MSPTEHAIVEHARAHAPEGVALLERAVNINSGTLHLEGVRAVGQLFAGELDRSDSRPAGSTARRSNAPDIWSRSTRVPDRGSC